MILVTTATAIQGYQIVAYKGIAQVRAFDELQTNAEVLGANAILNTCYHNALDVDTLFHGTAVAIEPIPVTFRQNSGSGDTSNANPTLQESRA
ncbi:MAG: hypothetical protein ACRD11_16610 [Terriglobia bacterium]